MKMKTTIVLHDVSRGVTYPENLHVCNRYYKNPTSFCDCIFVPHNISSNRNQTIIKVLKKYSDSQCYWKKYSDFGGGKKNNLIQSFCHIT